MKLIGIVAVLLLVGCSKEIGIETDPYTEDITVLDGNGAVIYSDRYTIDIPVVIPESHLRKEKDTVWVEVDSDFVEVSRTDNKYGLQWSGRVGVSRDMVVSEFE